MMIRGDSQPRAPRRRRSICFLILRAYPCSAATIIVTVNAETLQLQHDRIKRWYYRRLKYKSARPPLFYSSSRSSYSQADKLSPPFIVRSFFYASSTMASRAKETAALATLFNPLVKNEQDLLTFSTTFCSHNAGDLALVQRRNPSKGGEIRFPENVHHQPGLIKTPSSIVALQLNDTVSSLS